MEPANKVGSLNSGGKQVSFEPENFLVYFIALTH